MKILNICKYKNNTGYDISLKGINKNDFWEIVKILKKLGLKRDFAEERRLKKFSDEVIYKGNPPKANPQYKTIDYNYKKEGNETMLGFSEYQKFLNLQWKDKKLNGKEIISLILSNTNISLK